MNSKKQSNENNIAKQISENLRDTELLKKRLQKLTATDDYVIDQVKGAGGEKNKKYDVQEAREFMKKQREKRMEELRFKKKEELKALELRKEKLQELQRKTKELVTRNVQMKRSRSKSPCFEKATNLGKPSATLNVKAASQAIFKECTHSNSTSKENVKSASDHKNSRSSSKDSNLLLAPEPLISPKLLDQNPHLLKVPNQNFHSKLDYSTKRYQEKHSQHLDNVLLSNVTLRSGYDTKKNDVPVWLKETREPDPYNFINTVKRQLKYGVNPPTSLAAEGTVEINDKDRYLKTKEQFQNKYVTGNSVSESDTSKNIPSLSTESATSVKRNAECVKSFSHSKSVDALKLGTGKFDNLVLTESNINCPIISLENITENNVEFAFPEEVNKIRKRLFDRFDSSSRSSIITFNRAKVSPNKVPEDHHLILMENNSEEVISSVERNDETENLPSQSLAGIDRLDIDDMKVLSSKNIDCLANNISKSEISTDTPNTNDNKSESEIKSGPIESKNSPLHSNQFKSLFSDFHPSGTCSLNSQKTSLSSKRSSKDKSNSFPSINKTLENSVLKNITLRYPQNSAQNQDKSNEIHFKFEAEIHLLNDFNKSLRQFSEIEEAFESLRCKNDAPPLTQDMSHNGGAVPATKSTTPSSQQAIKSLSDSNSFATINYSRGSEFLSETSDMILSGSSLRYSSKENNQSVIQYSSAVEDEFDKYGNSYSLEGLAVKNVVGISLQMFDQLIKDEDIRLENLRKILKIREKTLLDRTKGELAWLEIQRKQLKETGKVQEASVIKKKQRGILVRHQQEKHEMQRLKQMQKEAATNRKHVLKQQQNLIKKQMHNDIMLPKLKSFHQKERRLSGPLKVIQSHTSDSVKSNLEDENRTAGVTDDEVCTKTSQTFSVVCVRSESDNNISKVESLEITGKYDRELDISTMKRTLLMKERALEKRRKAAEELLKWHKKLLEEEKAIVELEATASRIISQIPSAGKVKIGKFNTLKRNVSEPDVTSLEKETTVRSMSRCSEKLGSSVTDFSLYARELVEEERYIPKKQSEESAISSNYTADFEAESVPEDLNVDTVEQSKISSISDLIENFSKIQEDISNLSHVQSKILSENEEAKAPEAGDEKPSSVISSAVSVESVVQLTTEEESEQAQSNANVSTEEGNIVLNEPTEDTNTAIQTSASVEEPVESQEFDTEVEMGGANQTFVVTRGTEGEEDKSEQPISMDEKFERPSSTSKNESEHQNSADSNHSSSISSQITKDVKEDANAEEQSRITESQANVSEGTRLESISVEENLSLTSHASLSVREVTEQDVTSTSSDKISTENKTDEEKAASISKQTAGASSLQDDVQMSEQKDTESRTIVDVKQRVSEIMSEVSRCEKSPRMQDLCVMTYDLTSPPNSPELDTASEIDKRVYLGSVAEELLKKQLAIEQEIKLLTEQQVIYREIPNKPPPPYTPPATVKPVPAPTVIPRNKEEIEEITKYSAKIIYKAYMSKNLENITISDNTLNLIAKNIDKNAYKFVFDLCKEVAIEHFGQFEEETCPSWFRRPKKVTLAPAKPLDATGLEKLMHKKLLEIFGYEKRNIRESTIIKWSRKKRDHVDELLVQEMQAEESSWTNFDDDELIVKDRVTNEILEQLLQDTAQCLLRVWQKKCQK